MRLKSSWTPPKAKLCTEPSKTWKAADREIDEIDVDFSRHLPSCLRCAACLSPHHGKKERWWVHKSCQTRIEALGKTSWMNILAEKVLNMCLILADFEIFWLCVGGSVSFVLRFRKSMELRITSTTLDPHSDSVWPRTRACRPCDEGWCPWKQHFGVVNFLLFGFRDWIHWILIVIIILSWFWRTSWLTKGHLEGQLIFFRDQTSADLGELTWRGACVSEHCLNWGSGDNRSVGFCVHFKNSVQT